MPYEGFFPALGTMRRGRFSLAADLLVDYSIKTAALVFMSGSKISAGFDIAGRGALFNIAVKESSEKKSMAEKVLDLARALAKAVGIDESAMASSAPELFVRDDEVVSARGFLEELYIDKDESFVAMHPGGVYPSQRWAKEKFARLCDMMAEKYNVKILLIGSSGENNISDDIIKLSKSSHPVAINGLPLDKLVAVMSLAKLVVCNNSGPLHIAAALDVPTVSTMGPTVEHLWQPCGEGHIVVRKGASVDLITVEDMLAAVDRQMNR
jgi:ADP-heptose:LPS heptosyltransferase